MALAFDPTEARARAEAADASEELPPGTRLMHGQYVIDGFLGAGGFGITYVARDSLNRRVVVKECFPGAFARRDGAAVRPRSRARADDLRAVVRLFAQEAQSLARVEHPNVVGVHHVFEENGTAYMALDHVAGEDLLQLLEAGHRPPPRSVETMARALIGAVSAVHACGMLHRDVAPDNVIVTPEGVPVLIDFGAARSLEAGRSAGAVLRVLGLRVVKDGYSPPEFYAADARQSRASDLYALAATLHHLVTGSVPPDAQARLHAVARGDPDPFRPALGRVDGYAHAFLEALDDAMALRPEDRIDTADAWLTRIPDAPTPPPPRRRGPMAAYAVAALATVGGVAFVVAGAARMPEVAASLAAAVPPAGPGVTVPSGAPPRSARTSAPALGGSDAIVPPPSVARAASAPTFARPMGPATPASRSAPVAPDAPAPAVPVVSDMAPRVAMATAPVVGGDAVAPPPSLPTMQAAAVPMPARPASVAAPGPRSAPVVGPTRPAPVAPSDAAPRVAMVSAPMVSGADATVPPPAAASASAAPSPVLPPGPADPVPRPAPPVGAPRPAPVAAATPDVTPARPPDAAAPRAAAVAAAPAPARAAVPSDPVPTAGAPRVPTDAPPMPDPIPTTAEVVTAWGVDLPAATGFVLRPGVERIASVEGEPVSDRTAFDAVLRDLPLPQDARDVALRVRLEASDGIVRDATWRLPLVQRTLTASGLGFEARPSGAGWETRVTAVPAALRGEVRRGDVVVGHIPTDRRIEGRLTLPRLLREAARDGTGRVPLAVGRDGMVYAASVPVGAAPRE